MDLEALKERAAQEALTRVTSGMRLGLGTGSTVFWFLKHLGAHLADGTLTDIAGVPTSERTVDLCREFGIPVRTLEDESTLDLGVDGADEVAPGLDLIKGLGGALLREKMVATACTHFVVIADETKKVDALGMRSPLPVEVVPFAWRSHVPFLIDLGSEPVLRTTADGEPYHTDNGNLILDCRFEGGMQRPAAEIEAELRLRPGIVESGLFLGMADEAVLASGGGIEILAAGG
ncbi:MAG: ribose 5-phosphate isomerase A [Phycisphaeraceae bacterium]|nr:ribose 5-phosphate isomerase A [Phycisphaeraceae bacterium]